MYIIYIIHIYNIIYIYKIYKIYNNKNIQNVVHNYKITSRIRIIIFEVIQGKFNIQFRFLIWTR
jgi:hypothetical protein